MINKKTFKTSQRTQKNEFQKMQESWSSLLLEISKQNLDE